MKGVVMGYKSERWADSSGLLGLVSSGLLGFIVGVLGVAVGCAAGMGVVWLLWLAWGVFVPAVWPNGPYQIINIGYWPFLAGWVIMVTVVSVFRKRI